MEPSGRNRFAARMVRRGLRFESGRGLLSTSAFVGDERVERVAGSAPSTRRTLPSPSTLLRRIWSARQPSRATRVLSREVGDCYASERERLLVRLRSAATSSRVSSASARRTRSRTSCSPSSDAFTTLRRGVVVSRARANTRSFLLLRQLPLVVAGKGLTIPGPNLCVGSYGVGRRHARAVDGCSASV
jgi:hypothetical protein